jgi:hypothetical protein
MFPAGRSRAPANVSRWCWLSYKSGWSAHPWAQKTLFSSAAAKTFPSAAAKTFPSAASNGTHRQ